MPIFISIKEAHVEDATLIMFPIPDDGVISLEDFRGAFPNMTSLRYTDDGEDLQHHVMCRDNKFIQPDGGWGKVDRLFLAVCAAGTTNGCGAKGRFGLFESYRRQLATKNTGTTIIAKGKKGSRSTATSDEYTMVRVGHGHYKCGKFSRISANNLSGQGGVVVVGPFPKQGNTGNAIKDKAFEKFSEVNRWFRKKFKDSKNFVLVYPDGSLADKLPNGDEFSLESYKNYLDPQARYERLRLFICEKRGYECNQPFDLVSVSSSDDDDDALPPLTSTPRRSTDTVTFGSFIQSEETINVTTEVCFWHGEDNFRETFPNNAKIEVLIDYVSQKTGIRRQILSIADRQTGLEIADERLLELTRTSPILHVNVIQKDESRNSGVKDVEDPISAEYAAVSRTGKELAEKAVANMNGRSEPTEILREFRKLFLQGRDLDVTSEAETIEGDTSVLYISRQDIFDDALDEIRHIQNIRFPVQVCFHGEGATDLGGPRREFFTLFINKVKEFMLDEESGCVRLVYNPEYIARHKYFLTGILIGLSALEDGPLSPFLMELLNGPYKNKEETIQLKDGLSRVGLKELIDMTSTVKYLFQPSATRKLNVNSFIRTFDVRFSADGSSARVREERAFKEFVRYSREVYAGRRGYVSLQRILRFCTGSDEEPILGFTIKPTILFGSGTIPTGNTCINQMILPVDVNFDLMDLAYCNDYFGKA